MELEQFKLLIEAATAAGDGAYSLAVLWMIKGFVQYLLLIGLGFFVAYVTYKTLSREYDNKLYIARLKSHFGIRDFDQYERDLIIQWATEGRDARIKAKQPC